MGAGERKVIEILRVIHSSGRNSLILIDELDLTLHTNALKNLISVMIRLSEEKSLQIIFTSHREDILKLDLIKEKFDIKYITNRLSENKTECLNNITSEGMLELTGQENIERYIYVEDEVSKMIVGHFLSKHDLYDSSNIIVYGAIDNSFTIACGLYLSHKDLFDKSYFVLDGDKYISETEKINQIKSKISGTEIDIESKRKDILHKMIQFNPNNPESPEKFISNVILNLSEDSSEKRILEKLKRQNTSGDNHGLFPTDDTQKVMVITKFSQQEDIWNSYIRELNEKFLQINEVQP